MSSVATERAAVIGEALAGTEMLVQHKVRPSDGGFHATLTALLALVLVVVSCSAEEATGSVNKCATDLFSSYNPKVLDQ